MNQGLPFDHGRGEKVLAPGWALGFLSLCIALGYWRTLTAPFLLDDFDSFVGNSGPRTFAEICTLDAGSGLVGRPVAALTFLGNYWFGAGSLAGYHAVNLAVHLFASFFWFLLLRETLVRHPFSETVRRVAGLLSLAIAAIWALHPVQTEAVTYISQRTEALMGLFYGAGLWASARSWRSARPGAWLTGAWLAMALGAGCKEIIVTLPMVAWLWDRAFSGLSDAELRRKRGFHYGSLVIVSVAIVTSHFSIDYENVGAGLGVSAFDYALHSAGSMLTYAKLSVFPHPLIFDYGLRLETDVATQLPLLCLWLVVGGVIARGLWLRRTWAFAAALFFGVLAPVSSVVPVLGQPTADHRLYVSSIAAVASIAVFMVNLVGARRALPLAALWLVTFGSLTWLRNEDYRSATRLMEDTLAKVPNNERAMNNLAAQFFEIPERRLEGIQLLDRAIALRPDYGDAYVNRGTLKAYFADRVEEAIVDLERGLLLRPGASGSWVNYARVLAKVPARREAALLAFERALQLDPENRDAWEGKGTLLAAGVGGDAALPFNQAVLERFPDSRRALLNVGTLLTREPGRIYEAIETFRRALAYDYGDGETLFALASTLMDLPEGRTEALFLLRCCLLVQPQNSAACLNLGQLLAERPEGLEEATRLFVRATEIDPESADSHYNAAVALERQKGRTGDAISHLEQVLRLQPQDEAARVLLARLRQQDSGL